MPCINCYISWVQQASTYIGLPVLIWLLAQLQRMFRSTGTAPPRYGPRWAPPFVGGVMAAVKLGQDEDGYIAHCAETYGPVVYLPWPLCQYMISDSETIQRVYEASSRELSFPPIRTSMSHAIFGTGMDVCNSGTMEKQLYPAHAKSLAKNQLSQPMDRFVASVKVQIDHLLGQVDASDGQVVTADASDLVNNLIFNGAVPSLFGSYLYPSSTATEAEKVSPKALSADKIHQAFKDFDAAFPLLASGLLPPWLQNLIPMIKRGLTSRERLLDHFQDWVERGAPDCDSGPIRAMVDVGERAGQSPRETATWVLGTFWAMQANAPFASTHVLLHLLQAPRETREALRKELDAYLADAGAGNPGGAGGVGDEAALSFDALARSDVLPLLTSAIFETLRMESSTFSIRNVEAKEGYAIVTGQNGGIHKSVVDSTGTNEPGRVAVVPQGARIVCATRLSQLSGPQWHDNTGEASRVDGQARTGADDEPFSAREWDATRFLGEQGKKRTRELRAFGGGISICEGRHLALVEIKVTVLLLLATFDINVVACASDSDSASTVAPTGTSSRHPNPRGHHCRRALKFKAGRDGIAPRRVEGRVGMGIFQARSGDVAFELRRRGAAGDARTI